MLLLCSRIARSLVQQNFVVYIHVSYRSEALIYKSVCADVCAPPFQTGLANLASRPTRASGIFPQIAEEPNSPFACQGPTDGSLPPQSLASSGSAALAFKNSYPSGYLDQWTAAANTKTSQTNSTALGGRLPADDSPATPAKLLNDKLSNGVQHATEDIKTPNKLASYASAAQVLSAFSSQKEVPKYKVHPSLPNPPEFLEGRSSWGAMWWFSSLLVSK